MSRHFLRITRTITLTYGEDIAVGSFIDIRDERFANNPQDKQGEGFVYEWSEKFNDTVNYLGLERAQVNAYNMDLIVMRCDIFINQLNSLTYN